MLADYGQSRRWIMAEKWITLESFLPNLCKQPPPPQGANKTPQIKSSDDLTTNPNALKIWQGRPPAHQLKSLWQIDSICAYPSHCMHLLQQAYLSSVVLSRLTIKGAITPNDGTHIHITYVALFNVVGINWSSVNIVWQEIHGPLLLKNNFVPASDAWFL